MIEYSVWLIDKDGLEFQLIFDSKETKENYIKKEMVYCKTEMCNNIASIDQSARTKAKLALYAKRVTFAITSGYKPVGHEKKRWFFNPEKPENILA